jgi:hypothetical protein
MKQPSPPKTAAPHKAAAKISFSTAPHKAEAKIGMYGATLAGEKAWRSSEVEHLKPILSKA